MTSAPTEIQPWSSRRWVLFNVGVFGLQLLLIFWLSDRRPVTVRLPGPTPGLQFAGEDCSELLALIDPTLFALPSPRSFSGKAWLQAPPVQFRPFDWSEPAAWLPLEGDQLGAVFNDFMHTNAFSAPQLPAMLAPQPVLPEISVSPLAPERSSVRIAGELLGRRLTTPVSLVSWPHTDMLANTVVQLVVDGQGKPVSATLLASCGLKAADDFAIEVARDARFEPVPGAEGTSGAVSLSELQWGQLVFEWQTLPMPSTNAPAPAP